MPARTGGTRSPSPGLPRPPNATICRFVPHAAVLARASCAVTHGGMGTTLKALDRGVPVCAVPFARDQAEVARRVEVAEKEVRTMGSKGDLLRSPAAA